MRRIRDLNGAAGNAPASPVSADHIQTRCLAGTAARPPVLTVELRPTPSWAGICEQWSKYYAPKFILGFHRCNWHRRLGRGHRRAGCATLSGVRRNQGGLQAGGIYSGPCQDRRRDFCGLHRANHARNVATTPSQQAFAADQFAACGGLQSAEPELRPNEAQRAPIATDRGTNSGEPTASPVVILLARTDASSGAACCICSGRIGTKRQ